MARSPKKRRNTAKASKLYAASPEYSAVRKKMLKHLLGLVPPPPFLPDWHNSGSKCPPGHLRDMATELTYRSIGNRRVSVAALFARIAAFERWLAPHFASANYDVWQAGLGALGASAGNSKCGPSPRPLSVAAVIAWAEAYLAFKREPAK